MSYYFSCHFLYSLLRFICVIRFLFLFLSLQRRRLHRTKPISSYHQLSGLPHRLRPKPRRLLLLLQRAPHRIKALRPLVQSVMQSRPILAISQIFIVHKSFPQIRFIPASVCASGFLLKKPLIAVYLQLPSASLLCATIASSTCSLISPREGHHF